MSKLLGNCPVCGSKMQKGYVSATPGIFWSRKKIGLRSLRSGWEALLGGHFTGVMVNAEAQRCSSCKIVLFSYEKEKSHALRDNLSRKRSLK